MHIVTHGEMAEWLKAHAWKACLLERATRVRTPLSPPGEVWRAYFTSLVKGVDNNPLLFYA